MSPSTGNSAPVGNARKELGQALFGRAEDVASTVLRRWEKMKGADFAAHEDVNRDIARTTHLATITVAQFLTTGSFPTAEQAKELAATGKAPLRNTVSLKELTRLYLYWRDATIAIVLEETGRLGSDRATIDEALFVVHAGFDGSIMRMAKEFDAERQRLQDQVVEEQTRLTHQALHDALTGLPNRTLILDRLSHALDRSSRQLSRTAVLFVDLDHFKVINDVAGHSTGDAVLVGVAARLREAVRSGDTVGRLGGDEFVVLCEDLTGGEHEAEGLAQRIAVLLAEPFCLEDREVFVSASIGVAFAKGADDAADLLAQADRAMYFAKDRGRARYEVYCTDIDEGLERRAELLNSLHPACERGELHLHYQPVRMLHDNQVTTMEALLRWDHATLGNIPPAEFIPLAEETGLIRDIGRWVITQACNDCAEWRRRDASDVGVSINISGHQLGDVELVDFVRSALEEAELPGEVVTLELTESVLFSDAPYVRETLAELHALGVRLAIDDFGTGYSSLSYLSKYPIDIVKIDRSFVAGLDQTGRNSTIVFATIELAHALGLTVVAEGVETEGELAELRNASCDAAQGFLLGRPAHLTTSTQHRA
ncbi:MAG TPA: EAL domain-containing protein [Acidimicrobiia bacterium]|nr:EAL domain-containing protein [Acidimicrobiia bacterium]